MPDHGGRLLQAVQRYGHPRERWLDLSTGINPRAWQGPAIPVSSWNRLPEDEDGLVEAAQSYYSAPLALPVSGSQAAIQTLPKLRDRSRVGVPMLGYNEHGYRWTAAGHEVVPLTAGEFGAAAGELDVLVISNPNNPTGERVTAAELLEWHRLLVARGGWLVVDEAFADASPENSVARFTDRDGLIVLRSLGKFFGLAGARVGFVLARAPLLTELSAVLGPWPVPGPSRWVARGALSDRTWQQETRQDLCAAGARLEGLLSSHGLAPDGGCELFQWVRTSEALGIHEELARQGILTRYFASDPSLRFGLPGAEGEWERLGRALRELRSTGAGVAGARSAGARSAGARSAGAGSAGAGSTGAGPGTSGGTAVTARTLMIQGTTSDAGKSTLVAGLCRVLKRRGISVAPFKPQNMALNSAVTVDGGEIGRAQALQAQAAGIDPTTDMNPILLKPNTDLGAQVIVNGRAVGNMPAAEYHRYKPIARQAVLASHGRLAAQYEVIVAEGAGSPAEINLREGDIANMGFAEAVDCPVILVADIERGGVFAHLVGTVELLSPSEQQRIVGFVINRFRGDVALLEPGLRWLEQRTGKPVLGVLPYLHGLRLDAEDAIQRDKRDSEVVLAKDAAVPDDAGLRSSSRPGPSRSGMGQPGVPQLSAGGQNVLRIIVPVFPRVSNHTDFDPLREHPQVDFSYVGPGEAPPAADLVILPGSKSVRSDLVWLRQNGWVEYLERHLRYGGRVIGICGGFQMLGRTIADPLGLEGAAGESPGLQWLDLETVLEAEKQLRNTSGVLTLDGAEVHGYEIHAGVTRGRALESPSAMLEGKRPDGVLSSDGQILGTYLHGIFESPAACVALLRWAGLREPRKIDYREVRERAIERLADSLEAHLDLAVILRLLGLEAKAGLLA